MMLKESLRRAEIIIKHHEAVMEGAHASMVVQNLHLRKLNGALHGRERERESNRSLVIDSSKGQVFSSSDVFNGLKDQQEKKELAANAKQSRKEAREARKAGKARVEAEWEKAKIEYENAKAEWKRTCESLHACNVPKKEFPKPPTRRLKKDIEAELLGGESDDEEVEDNEDE